MHKIYDYLIVGQGLAGSALAWHLIKRGRSVLVIDKPGLTRASAVAAGLCNPITGKSMTKTWKADEIFPFLHIFYREAESHFKKRFFFPIPIYRPFSSANERTSWKKQNETTSVEKFVGALHDESVFGTFVRDPFGGIEMNHSAFLQVSSWITSMRDFLIEKNSFREERFQSALMKSGDPHEYHDTSARKIVFCDGAAALDSSWFDWLPLRPLKGELVKVRVAGLPERIFNHGVYLVPTEEEHVYWAGSTYQHLPYTHGTTEEAKIDLQKKLAALLNSPFEIVHQEWGIRPTVTDRRALLGEHPAHKNMFIFNGLGTKGVSLAPYLAASLADSMEGVRDLPAEVNISRFKTLYSG